MALCKRDFPVVSGMADQHSLTRVHPLVSMIATALSQTETERTKHVPIIDVVLSETLDSAIGKCDQIALKAIHLTLDELLRLRMERAVGDADRSPTLFSVQQKIINSVYESDKKSISVQPPSDPVGFKTWFDMKCAEYQSSPHPVFDYIEHRAGRKGFEHFISQEAGVHVAFDDVLAAVQMGTRGARKLEFFENFKDEMGSGDPDKFHLTMFGRLLSELDVDKIKKEDLSWQALSCGNYMMFLSSFRSHFHECIGYLGFLEALTPARFSKIARGGLRLGLSKDAMMYHTEHSELDVEHTAGWVDHIIIPEISDNPLHANAIGTGVLLRESISRKYWDELLSGCLEADGLDHRLQMSSRANSQPHQEPKNG